ncbi:MAG: hypothetical protein E5V66_05055 [Mesorhizobium sp.]|uniref:hypothetical protein n=1 Tax=unclassified Mesorhizobium TaxID=325217 RepID=UPI000F761427|nr:MULTISPECIES: hypothetical protein [unclassified Mesorhizobium]AZO50307.1 hypothetical protein EJ073_22930 [Mesorhizobium sp. M4B.F.Ca.ET.058.02.1.1]RWD38339.1 MAG: hypothetical protein EOS33_00545 [Mesorhizobium sp.]TIW13195.1 MAG: hypothetical protein E5V66_05055 [Mesorhizobium sp.]TIW37414.1 MAG: hypothetical protein E5V62_01865 [Mesorhizobium sp.]
MVSLLFAGIKISPFIAGHLMSKLLTQEVMFSAENWPTFDWNGGRNEIGMTGRLQIGMAAGFTSESAGLLFFRFRLDESHLRPLGPNHSRLGIGGIVLLALY